MKTSLLWLMLSVGLAAGANVERQPVLVELFTSEGCSSCPPADAVLEALDREQPVSGAMAIVLSEHVDYWNEGGWADPFSSRTFSARQEDYALRFGLGGPYTPEMVVDGRTEFVGSNRGAATAAIRSAAQQPKIAVRLIAAGPAISVHVDPLPAGRARNAAVYAVRAVDDAASHVLRGENKGRRLHHVSIARDLRLLGSVTDRSGLDLALPLLPAAERLVVFVQEKGTGRVWGAGVYPARPSPGEARNHPL